VLVEFRILGPVELWSGDQPHEVGRAQERCVLANLLFTPGHPVAMPKLLDRVWEVDQSSQAKKNLYPCISHLRKRLKDLNCDATIETLRPGGYVIRVDPLTIDLHLSRQLRLQSRAIAESGDDERALALLNEAIGLWRGEPLANVTGAWAARIRTGLEEELFGAVLERIEVKLRLGRHADVISELAELMARYPLDEKLAEYLMEAQYRCGRQAEALKVYQDFHRRLRNEGLEPPYSLRELQQRILRRDRTLLPVPRREPADVVPPNTLPEDIRYFVGRDTETVELLDTVSPAVAGEEAPPTVVAIDGMAGIGKTVFAVHVAHKLAAEYPDGRLYIDLHAYDAEQETTDPLAALDTLLRMLGISSQRIPRSLEERTSLWRAELARRRVLLVLDNAGGHEQVRPLLPGAPGCLTLVTSRRRLAGLDDVRSFSLDVLSPADATRLLELTIGPDRSRGAGDLAEVVRHCGHLPMAVQLIGNRLRHRPKLSAVELAKRLARDKQRLAEIRAEDREISVAFDLSFRSLGTPLQDAFRQLGHHLGSEFTCHSAAAALGCSFAEADRMIDDLLDHHLVTEPVGGRFRFHNLLRDYARGLAERVDSEIERRHVIQRQLDHYVSTALLADRLLNPLEHHMAAGYVYPPPDPPPIETAEQARDWMKVEYQNLLIVAEYAAHERSPTHVALLAHGLARYLEKWGHWDDAVGLHQRAVAAWHELEDVSGEAQALLDLSIVRFRMGRYADANEHAQESLELFRSRADQCGEAKAIDQVGLIHWHLSQYQDALSRSRAALQIRRSLGDRRGEARTLDHIAIFLEFIGEYQEAADQRMRALEIYGAIGDPQGLQMSLNNNGDLALRLGRVEEASSFYEQAASVFQVRGPQHDAILINNLARIKRYTGHHDDALAGFRQSIHTYQQLGDRRNEVETLIEIGVTYKSMGRYSEALVHIENALALARDLSEVYEEAKALRFRGEILLDSGRPTTALAYFKEAKALADAIGEPFERAKALEGIGTVALQIGSRYQARKHLRQALRFYHRVGMVREARAVRALLDGDSNGSNG
jgi:DNA-binding SARP family transcriptional activator